MSEPGDLTPLLAVLRDLAIWLQAGKVSGTVIGGLAASLLGRPRLTRSVDMLVLVDESHWASLWLREQNMGLSRCAPMP